VYGCETFALLVEAHDSTGLLSPPLLESVGVFGGHFDGALGLGPLGVDLEAEVAEARESFSSQMRQLVCIVSFVRLERRGEGALAAASRLIERIGRGAQVHG
jgi:hypothetical protein